MTTQIAVVADFDPMLNQYGWLPYADRGASNAIDSDEKAEKTVVDRRLRDIRKVLWVWHVNQANQWTRNLMDAGIAGGILLGNRRLEASAGGRFARGVGLAVLCAGGVWSAWCSFAGAGALAQLARHT